MAQFNESIPLITAKVLNLLTKRTVDTTNGSVRTVKTALGADKSN